LNADALWSAMRAPLFRLSEEMRGTAAAVFRRGGTVQFLGFRVQHFWVDGRVPSPLRGWASINAISQDFVLG
jgi:hypothetical protein